MRIYFHIGYPKCLSTTLQRYYFEKHPQIWYGGVGIKDNISYVDEETEFFFEILLKYSRNEFYKQHKRRIQAHFKNIISKKEKIVFSSEHIAMNFTLQGLQFQDKIDRIAEVFENFQIEFILIHREKESFLKSIYKELVKMGYYKEYYEFHKWVYRFQDRNFFIDLDVPSKVKQLQNVGKTHVLKFEELLEGNLEKNLNTEFSKILEVENIWLPIKNKNPSLTDLEVEKLLEINKTNNRGVGEDMLEPFEHMRNRLLLKLTDPSISNNEIFKNTLSKREALSQIKSANT